MEKGQSICSENQATGFFVINWLSIINRVKASCKVCKTILSMHGIYCIKGTAMEITAAPINDRLRVSKVSCKFPIPTIYNFGVIDP